MKKIHREIIKKAGCDVLDLSFDTIPEIKRDLEKRLKKQEKALQKTIEKRWDGQWAIEQSISAIKQTLSVL